MSIILDTNVALYWLKDMLLNPLPAERLFVSVITELELLSFPFANDAEEQGVHSFLARLEIIDLCETVKQHAIALRRSRKLKLPDAIIAGTALALDADLFSNDETMLHVPGLRCTRMSLK